MSYYQHTIFYFYQLTAIPNINNTIYNFAAKFNSWHSYTLHLYLEDGIEKTEMQVAKWSVKLCHNYGFVAQNFI